MTPVRAGAVKDFIHHLSPNIAPSTQPKPGGFRTGSAMPYWQDGEWPITPWYGLAYVISERSARTKMEKPQ
jgi:hypothetical protein